MRTLQSIQILFAILIASIITFSFSCKNSTEQTGENSVLPDTLQTAMDYAQFGIMSMYRFYDFPTAKIALEKALQLDSNLTLAHIQYGWYLNLMKEDEEAAKHFLKACQLEPNNPQWRIWRGLHCFFGLQDIECLEQEVAATLAIDSTFAEAYWAHGIQTIEQGNPKAAIPHMKKAFANPRFMDGLGQAYANSGYRDSALRVIDQMIAAEDPWQFLGIAGIFVSLNDNDQAYEWLDKAYETRHPFLPWASDIPPFRLIRDQERFKEFFVKMGL